MSHKRANVLVTRRLTLRAPLPLDADAIAAHLNNINVARNLSKVPHPYGVSDAEDWIAQVRHERCCFTIHRERLIGVVHVRDAADRPMLGYWLAQRWWGHGYMVEAAMAALARAFDFYNTDEIGSYAITENHASLAIIEKLGFEETGRGTVFIPSRDAGYPTIKTVLTRSRFERLLESEARKAAA